MGGSSSKARKIKYDVSHTVEGDIISTNCSDTTESKKSAEEKKKKKKRTSVKIKERRSIKKSIRCKDAPAAIASVSVAAGDSPLPGDAIYRKKSSCPSCEAADILLGKNRSRSDSDKSLRFSDFNKILRKTRIYDWEMIPADIPLYEMEEPKQDEICYICEVYTGSHVRTCRVCSRAYHDGCLSKIGHNLNNSRLTALDKWTCHQCMSLNHLLTMEEVKRVLDELEYLEISKDNMTEADYVKFCRHSLQRENKMFTSEKEQNCLKRYRSVVHHKSGTISFLQFLDIESLRMLKKRCKESLVHLLTPAELWEARRVFQNLDMSKTGVITRAAILASPDVSKSWAPTCCHDDSIMYIDEDLDSPVTWADFLGDTAIFILGQRSNFAYTNAENCAQDEAEDGTLTYSSCNSLDVDDEHYITCTSDPETGVSYEDHPKSHPQQTGAQLDGSMEGQISPLNASTMVDELNCAMDKFCSKHEEDRVQAETTRMDLNHKESSLFEQHCSSTSHHGAVVQETMHFSPHNSDNSHTDKKPACIQKNGHQAIVDPRPSSERIRSSLYNDSRHSPIPWEDVENRRSSNDQDPGRTRATHRRSEIIPRQIPASTGQTRAVSQVGCRSGRNILAPAYGNFIGRGNNEDWGC